jgi:hypothetical protein
MDHAFMLNTSERPREDGDVEGLFAEGEILRLGVGEASFVFQFGWAIYRSDAQGISVRVQSDGKGRSVCVLPRQPAFAASDLKDSFVVEVRKSMKIFFLVAFGIFEEGHVVG